MKIFIEKLLEFLSSSNGDLSSKRLGGLSCMFLGCIEKVILFIYGLFAEPKVEFKTLDSSAEDLIIIGACLLGAGLIELFSKNKNKNVQSV